MAPSASELDALASTHVSEQIPTETLVSVLTAPPFIPTQSMINIRDMGAVEGSAIAPGRIFRCGTLEATRKDPQAIAWLSGNVRRIFDLRKEEERKAGPDPVIPSIDNVWRECEGNYGIPKLADFAENDRAAWKKQLMSALMSYRPTIRAIMEHVRDRPSEPFLFHCTAGRDRTGIVGSLLQSLAGTPEDAVIRDYMLSRIGTEPAREKLVQYAMASVGTDDPTTPGFYEIASLRPEYLTAYIEGVHEEFGSWDGYVTKGLGLSDVDLATIKMNLRQ